MTDDGFKRSNNGAEDPADQAPNCVTPVEEMLSENKHGEENQGDDDGKNRPSRDVALAVGRMLGTHVGLGISTSPARMQLAVFQTGTWGKIL